MSAKIELITQESSDSLVKKIDNFAQILVKA